MIRAAIVARWYAREIELSIFSFERQVRQHDHFARASFHLHEDEEDAGTAIEAALSELCGPEDVITPYREESEQDRKGLSPQNYRIEHPKTEAPCGKFLGGRSATTIRASVTSTCRRPALYVGDEIYAAISNSPSINPDRQIPYFYKTNEGERPSFESHKRRRAYVDNHEII
jgi:hypothetical protein